MSYSLAYFPILWSHIVRCAEVAHFYYMASVYVKLIQNLSKIDPCQLGRDMSVKPQTLLTYLSPIAHKKPSNNFKILNIFIDSNKLKVQSLKICNVCIFQESLLSVDNLLTVSLCKKKINFFFNQSRIE